MDIGEIKMKALTSSREEWALLCAKIAKQYKNKPPYVVDELTNKLTDLKNPNNYWFNRYINDLIGAILDARN